MSKHALDLSAVKELRERKSQRIYSVEDDGGSSSGQSDSNSIEGNKEPCISLKSRLTSSLFHDRPARHEITAVEYILSLPASSTPNANDFQDFVKAAYPSAPLSGVAKSWDTLRRYFTSGRDEDYEDIQNLIDVPSLVAAFHAASQISPEPSGPRTASTSMPPPTITSSVSSSSRSSRASSSRGQGSISSGGSKNSSSNESGGGISSRLTANQAAMMHDLFKYNFEQFPGQEWILPSGVTVDSLLYGVALNQCYESTLHSFVLEDPTMIIQLAKDDRDQDAIKSLCIDRTQELMPPLSEAETNFLQLYCKSPDELDELLSIHGWRAMGAEMDDKPTEEFRRVTHNCVSAILTAYQQSGFSVPRGSSESCCDTQITTIYRQSASYTNRGDSSSGSRHKDS
ncbi:MAG: hypothetical protein J3Q66DRAFT_370826 [Benniella sp.]|nr:MAG: hypothetical protein J3Q66DRAFT_370826 [Benniella sp.]